MMICKDCGKKTNDFYPIPKSKEVRCSACYEDAMRHKSVMHEANLRLSKRSYQSQRR